MAIEQTQLVASPQIESANFNISQFCKYAGFSRPFYYTLPKHKRPAETRIAGKILISRRTADEWLNAHEDRKAQAA